MAKFCSVMGLALVLLLASASVIDAQRAPAYDRPPRERFRLRPSQGTCMAINFECMHPPRPATYSAPNQQARYSIAV